MNRTAKNLITAFIGESQARNRYAIYAKIAKKEGYEQISAIFEETAEQEREHAKWLFRLVNELNSGEEISIETSSSASVGNTKENLQYAINGENHEHTSMYPEFANIADEENLPEIAARLRAIAKAELHHEERYKKLLVELENGSVFGKSNETNWICRKCGYLHTGNDAPEKCSSCSHPTAYFQVQCENY